MLSAPLLVFWGIAVWGLFRSSRVLIYLLFVSMSFGSMAAVPEGTLTGLTLLPASVVSMMIVLRELGKRHAIQHFVSMTVRPKCLMVLFAFWLVAVLITLFAPRFFAGVVPVIPMRGEDLSKTVMLYPTTQNYSQLAYLTLSIGLVYAFARMFISGAHRQYAMQGLVLGGAVVVVTGALDFFSQYVAIDPLLEPFRTADYSIVTEAKVKGLFTKRISGLMPEPSAFGSLALSFLAVLYFFRRAMEDSVLKSVVTPVLLFLLLVMVIISTSSTALVGLIVLTGFAVLEWGWRLITTNERNMVKTGAWVFFVLVAVVGAAYVKAPKLFIPLELIYQKMVVEKDESGSYEERGSWNRVALQALQETHGLGVGVGGARASSSVVSIASNTGYAGFALYIAFIVVSLTRVLSERYESRDMMKGVRWAFPVWFLVGSFAATSPDFGALGAFFFGLSLALALEDRLEIKQRARANLVSSKQRRRAERPVQKPIVPVNAKPTAAKPTAAKPTVAKPTVAKPTVAKPTVAKPTVAKPKPKVGVPDICL